MRSSPRIFLWLIPALLVCFSFFLVGYLFLTRPQVVPRTAPSVPLVSVLEDEPEHIERIPVVTSTDELVHAPLVAGAIQEPEAKSASSSQVASPATMPQFVLLSFDGSRSIPFWKETLRFAEEMKGQSKPVHFTYFMSGVYFLTPKNKDLYHPPHAATGTSLIGWGDSSADIANRIEQMNQAVSDGHEIASHANGHFNGSTWSQEDWEQEFSAFDALIKGVATNNHLSETVPNRSAIQFLSHGTFQGFRAPELGVSPGLWPVEKTHHMRYDASQTRKMTAQPTKNRQGIWSISLARIPFATTTQAILSMDYNFYFKQSAAKEVAKKGSVEWQTYYDQMLQSYRTYFQTNYHGSRAPVVIGHHFSLWNDGVYWEVMKQFASEVCGQPEVKCVTFSEYIDYLDQQ